MQLRCLLAAALTSLAAHSGSAQDPDTLDPRGYFPLEVGNTWEYVHDLYRPVTIGRPQDESETLLERYHILRSYIERDTTFYDLLLRIQKEDGTPVSVNVYKVWYDSTEASVRGPSIISWLRCLNSPYGTSDPAPFDCWPFVNREEVYDPDFFGTEAYVEVKTFSSFVYGMTVKHGIGVLSAGGGCEPCSPFDDSDYWTLKYANIAGRAYGAVILEIGDPSSTPRRHLAVYPNPVFGTAIIEAEGYSRIEVIDLLGRQVETVELDAGGRVQYDFDGYPPGVYFIVSAGQVQSVLVQ